MLIAIVMAMIKKIETLAWRKSTAWFVPWTCKAMIYKGLFWTFSENEGGGSKAVWNFSENSSDWERDLSLQASAKEAGILNDLSERISKWSHAFDLVPKAKFERKATLDSYSPPIVRFLPSLHILLLGEKYFLFFERNCLPSNCVKPWFSLYHENTV